MNFLGCDGVWSLSETGSPTCSGTLTAYTTEELGALVNPAALSIEDAQTLTGYTVALFTSVFVVLALKKVLSS